MTKETKMAAPSAETRAALGEVLCAFEALKDANDRRLDEIEAKSAADPLLDEKLARIDTALTRAQDRLDRLALFDGARWRVASFVRAELSEERTYRLARLISDSDIDFSDLSLPVRAVLLDEAVQKLELPTAERGLDMSFAGLAAGIIPDDALHSLQTNRYDGADLAPRAPCHLKDYRLADGVSISWIRRSRKDWDDWVSSEIPLGEDEELYSLRVEFGNAVIHEWLTSETSATILIEDLDARAGQAVPAFSIEVRQVSPTFGAGSAARLDIIV
ncbi:hypothetical protein V0U79_11820 [Hyphobacterium sp. HN65]|uniref:Uncharacterized protein n=1 Tax=Hyphobacterium lacteum TaxID=3116575 RepID=A0ABU7LT12_9PROT|nr:hypothetical protein [Hyphobacterium sp. HN65]MEE2527057.1 hypothetical protein [Hyphobacterium sp. HN65]